MSHEKMSTTTVRTAVARVEFTFSIPILARIAVTPAKNAEPRAKKSQSIIIPSDYGLNL